MIAPSGPVEGLRATVGRRVRIFTTLHAAMAATTVIVLGAFAYSAGVELFWWLFLYMLVVMPAGVPFVWWLNRRSLRRLFRAFEEMRLRIRYAGFFASVGYLLVFDNGLSFGLDPQSNALRFIAFFSPGGAILQPTLEQAKAWGSRIRGTSAAGSITSKKGNPEAQEQLERFRVRFGARWYVLVSREVRMNRLAPGEPMWRVGAVFFNPRWQEHARDIADELDPLARFLEEARTRYLPPGSSPA